MASNIGPLANTCPADAPSQGITGPPVPTASPLAAATPAPTAAANPAPIDATQAPEIPALSLCIYLSRIGLTQNPEHYIAA